MPVRNKIMLLITIVRNNALTRKCMLVQLKIIILSSDIALLIGAPSRDCKIAGSMPVLGINVNWQQALCVVWMTGAGVCFTTACTGKELLNKKHADMILPVSPKVFLGNKYSMLNAHESGG